MTTNFTPVAKGDRLRINDRVTIAGFGGSHETFEVTESLGNGMWAGRSISFTAPCTVIFFRCDVLYAYRPVR